MDLFEKYMESFPVQTELICAATAKNKLAHAYVVYSDAPDVREEFSILLAQIAACPERSSSGQPCAVCKICKHLAKKDFSELYELMPVSKSRQIPIGENKDDYGTMRWFQDCFYKSSVSGAMSKVGIISEADCLNQQAQNAFLKTLEEPPSKSIFILNTANPFSLLPTIISRCHTITLLKNRCQYVFNGKEEVIMALARLLLTAEKNLYVSEEVAKVLLDVSGKLIKEAENNVSPAWKEKFENAENPIYQYTAAMKKRLKEKFEAAVASEYLRLRSYFLSMIHSFYAQVYQLSCGVSMNDIANPDLFVHLDISHSIPKEDIAYKALLKSEQLLSNLNWNVNEELAVREFACSFH